MNTLIMKPLTERIHESVQKVINDPAHAYYGEPKRSDKNLLYTPELVRRLEERVYLIIKKLELDDEALPQRYKIMIINEFLKANIQIRHSYFDAFEERIPQITEDEIMYRSAYAALCEGETMCAGYTEAARILCESIGIDTKTLLSKLPGQNKRLLHYVTLANLNDGSSRIIDPERERSCDRKNYDFMKYQESMFYMLPNEYFYNHKIGKTGVGLEVDKYLRGAHRGGDFGPLFIIKTNKETNEINAYIGLKSKEIDLETGKSFVNCKSIDALFHNKVFMRYINRRDPVFVIQGTDYAYYLNKVDKFLKNNKSMNDEKELQND